MSLQTGGQLATTVTPVIDPATLAILAYQLEGSLLTEHPSYLLTADIRETGKLGIIVNSTDDFVTTGDVIKLDSLLELHFQPIGLRVIDDQKHRLGVVADVILETASFTIQQLAVRQTGLLKRLSSTELLISRSQIVEINDEAIVVRSTAIKAKKIAEGLTMPGTYTNPFRKNPQAQPEPIDHKN